MPDTYGLIKNCEFLICPSLYEGFGIPALEAMSLGKPVLAARTSSLPEIVEDAGLFFDPYSLDEFCRSFVELYNIRHVFASKLRNIERNNFFSINKTISCIRPWILE